MATSSDSSAPIRNQPNARRLRIAFCLSFFRPIESGAERQARRQAIELVRRGHQVIVLTRHIPGQPTREIDEGVEIHRAIRTLEIGPTFGLTFLGTLAYQLWRMHRRIDLVHCHQAQWEAVAAGWVAGRTRLPTLVQPAAGGDYGEIALLERTKGRKWLRKQVLRNRHFVAISQQIEDELVRFGVDRARIDHLCSGVDTSEYSPGSSAIESELPSGPRVLFLGRLHPQKNLPILLQAWQRVRTQRSDATLILAGAGPDREPLARQATELGVGSSVIFTGAVAQPRDYLRAAHVFVLPSLAEGMSNSLLEAMACALPSIVSNTGGNVDLIEHQKTGLVVNAQSPEDVAGALLQLLANPSERIALGHAARRHVVENYSIAAVVDRYEALYQRLVSSVY